MYYTLHTTNHKSFIITKTNLQLPHNPQPTPNQKRSLSKIGSDSYNRAKRRAFARTKLLAFFNPDLNQFITLTYQINQQNHTTVLQDIKKFIRKQKQYNKKNNIETSIKYIYVMEYQKRGAIHIHMISNKTFTTKINSNGYKELIFWPHGFTSVLGIDKTDHKFKPYLYLFKYMNKAQRIGSSFIHTSRNFDKIKWLDYDKYTDQLIRGNVLFEEDYAIKIGQNKQQARINKKYITTQEVPEITS